MVFEAMQIRNDVIQQIIISYLVSKNDYVKNNR